MAITTPLADVYMPQGRNARIPTTPGRSVQFFGGHAVIVNHLDMPHMLQMENVKVQPRPEAMPWATDWLRRTSEIRAEVDWPEGWGVEFANQNDFTVYENTRPTEGQHPAIKTETDPVETTDLTARPFGPFNPEDLLSDPDDPPAPPDLEPVPANRRRSKKGS